MLRSSAASSGAHDLRLAGARIVGTAVELPLSGLSRPSNLFGRLDNSCKSTSLALFDIAKSMSFTFSERRTGDELVVTVNSYSRLTAYHTYILC